MIEAASTRYRTSIRSTTLLLLAFGLLLLAWQQLIADGVLLAVPQPCPFLALAGTTVIVLRFGTRVPLPVAAVVLALCIGLDAFAARSLPLF